MHLQRWHHLPYSSFATCKVGRTGLIDKVKLGKSPLSKSQAGSGGSTMCSVLVRFESLDFGPTANKHLCPCKLPKRKSLKKLFSSSVALLATGPVFAIPDPATLDLQPWHVRIPPKSEFASKLVLDCAGIHTSDVVRGNV